MENSGSQYIDQAPLSAGVPAITPEYNRYLRVPLDGSNQWSTGLFDCCEDVNNCLITFVCPFVTFGQIAEILDRGSSSCGVSGAAYGLVCALTGCHFVYSCFYRTKMRAQYGLEETPCADFFAHLFCGWCSLCQEYRELRNRGFDMNIGWHANMERQAKRGAIDVPPHVFDGMTR